MSERVVLLDDDGRAIGDADKQEVHHAETPLHLAFSCYVGDTDGRLLVTRRAWDKRTFPGVLTNTVCGHPAPGEDVRDAVRRRARQELGIELSDLRLLLPRFRYRAVADDGVVENEMCPVFTARTTDAVDADPTEVAEHEWVDWPAFRRSVLDGTRGVSVWCAEQVAALPEDLFAASERPDGTLPPAARP
jgi:isopentenyl-diphosphate delta-isomerase